MREPRPSLPAGDGRTQPAARCRPGAAYLGLTMQPSPAGLRGRPDRPATPEAPFASAITGTDNLVAAVICRETESLYRYVTTKIGAATGVRKLEISPVLRRVKQAGTWMEARGSPRCRRRRRAAASSLESP